MGGSSGAIFLSYARDDAAAARRITEALRASGLEVWFDENELRGGEAWDAKIKSQIRQCALFIAVISATTQARGEGYFRREWKQAVERTHDMAASRAFLVPVVIDDTLEAHAEVPDELLRVQWTRLPGALPTPHFVEQVKRLLERKAAPLSDRRPVAAGGADRVVDPSPAPARPATTRPATGRSARWPWAIGFGVLAVGAIAYFTLRPTTNETHGTAAASAAGSVALSPSASPSILTLRPADSKSIAVLPFENMSADRDNAYFCDGIQEDILTNLGNVRELRVVSRTSVEQYRNTTKPIRQIAQELGVAWVLEGSVQRDGNKVRVTGQLINARTDEHVWAKAYDRDLTDIFAIQSELAETIAATLQAKLSPQEKDRLARRPTENIAAYELVLKAREIQRGGNYTPEWFASQERLLKSALQLDPNYAAAYADLAYIYSFAYFAAVPDPAKLAQAKAAIEAAERLAPAAPEVLRAEGDYYYYGRHDFVQAMEKYDRVAQLRPNDTALINRVASIQRREGHWTEAIAGFRRLAELDPADQRNIRDTAILLNGGRRFADATVEMRRYVERAPDVLRGRFELAYLPFIASGSTREMDEFLAGLTPEQANSDDGVALRRFWAERHGDFDEAIRLDAAKDSSIGAALDMATVWAARGDREKARARLGNVPAELRAEIAAMPESYAAWSLLGEAEALLGDKEEALRCARKAVELMPEARDALIGPSLRARLAFVYTWIGDKDAAIAEYAHLLHTPFGSLNGGGGYLADATVSVMKLDPRYAPLRGDPRFEALLNDPKNNAPLF